MSSGGQSPGRGGIHWTAGFFSGSGTVVVSHAYKTIQAQTGVRSATSPSTAVEGIRLRAVSILAPIVDGMHSQINPFVSSAATTGWT